MMSSEVGFVKPKDHNVCIQRMGKSAREFLAEAVCIMLHKTALQRLFPESGIASAGEYLMP